MPTLGPIAATELGVDLQHADPGPDWAEVVAALLDGLELVVTTAAPTVPPPLARRLSARARQRGSVLIGVGDWPGADLALDATAGTWYGLGEGRGRLRCRELTVVARGRGGAARARQVQMWLPALAAPPHVRRTGHGWGRRTGEPDHDDDRRQRLTPRPGPRASSMHRGSRRPARDEPSPFVLSPLRLRQEVNLDSVLRSGVLAGRNGGRTDPR